MAKAFFSFFVRKTLEEEVHMQTGGSAPKIYRIWHNGSKIFFKLFLLHLIIKKISKMKKSHQMRPDSCIQARYDHKERK